MFGISKFAGSLKLAKIIVGLNYRRPKLSSARRPKLNYRRPVGPNYRRPKLLSSAQIIVGPNYRRPKLSSAQIIVGPNYRRPKLSSAQIIKVGTKFSPKRYYSSPWLQHICDCIGYSIGTCARYAVECYCI